MKSNETHLHSLQTEFPSILWLHLAVPCPMPFSHHYFRGNVFFPLQSYFSLMGSLSCHVVCEAPLVALVGCDIFLLSNLGELCFYHLYVSPQLRFSTFHSWQGQVLTAQKRASGVISPVIWWPSTLQQSWLHIVLAPLIACIHLQGRLPHIFLSSVSIPHAKHRVLPKIYYFIYIYIYIYNFMNVLLRLKKIDPCLLKEKVQRVYLWGKEL